MIFKNKILITFFVLLAFILFFNISNVFASENIAFEGNVDEGAWNKIIELPEFISGNNHLYITKYYSVYKVFFVEKVDNYKCYFVKENNRVSKYGITSENNHLYFNQPVILNIYEINPDGSNCTKKYDNVTENSFICINPMDHAYSSTNIYTDNSYSTLFFQLPVLAVVVPTLETAEELPKAILETLRMIIPVCLVLLGMVLVTYLIRLLRYWI